MPIREERLRAPALNPVARPVNTYAPPPALDRGEDTLVGLARALSGLEPSLTRYAQERKAGKDEEAYERGLRQRLLDEANTELKQVALGERYRQESPWFQKGYRQQHGIVVAQQRASELRKQYTESGLADTTDPAAFDKWMAGAIQETLGDVDDPDAFAGARGIIESRLADLRGQHEQRVDENLYNGYLNNAAAEVHGLIDEEVERAAQDVRAFDPKSLWTSVNALKNRGRFLQIKPEDMTKLVVDATVDRAIRYADESLLDAVENDWTDPVTGKTVPGPGKSRYWLDMKETVLTRIEARQYEIENRRYAEENRQREEAKRQALSMVFNALSGDPYATLTPDLLRQIEETSPGAGLKAVEIQNTLRTWADRRSPAEAFSALEAGGFIENPADINKLADALPGLDMSTMRFALSQHFRARDYDERNGEGATAKLLKDPTVKDYLTRLDPAADPNGLAKDFDTTLLARARADFSRQATDWLMRNPEAGDFEKDEQIHLMFSKIVERARAAVAEAGQAKTAARAAALASGAPAASTPRASEIYKPTEALDAPAVVPAAKPNPYQTQPAARSEAAPTTPPE